jgi:hypothetical protein
MGGIAHGAATHDGNATEGESEKTAKMGGAKAWGMAEVVAEE